MQKKGLLLTLMTLVITVVAVSGFDMRAAVDPNEVAKAPTIEEVLDVEKVDLIKEAAKDTVLEYQSNKVVVKAEVIETEKETTMEEKEDSNVVETHKTIVKYEKNDYIVTIDPEGENNGSIEEHKHKYNKTTVEPTCTKEGKASYVCVECKHSYQEAIKKEAHTYNKEVIVPTTEAKGYTLYTCSVCGDSYKDNWKDKLVVFKEVNETVYSTTSLNVRKGPGADYSKVGALSTNQSVIRIGIGDNGWSKIKFNGQEAYASSKYLTTTKPVVKEDNAGSSTSHKKAITNNYNGMSSKEIEVVKQIMDYKSQCMSATNNDRIDIYVPGDFDYQSRSRIQTFFALKFATSDVPVMIGVTNQDGIMGCLFQMWPQDMAAYYQQEQNVNSKLDKIVSGFSGSDKDKLKQCADWLKNNISYSGDQGSGAKALSSGKGNCDAYAQLFMKMAMRMGIQCDWCSGTANGGGHAWNRVTFSDGSKRYYDICWYDSTGNSKYLNSSSCWHNLEAINSMF